MKTTDKILKELEHSREIQGKLFDEIRDVREKVSNNHLEVTKAMGRIETKVEVQKVKAGFIGAIGGAIPTSLALMWLLFKEYFTRGGK